MRHHSTLTHHAGQMWDVTKITRHSPNVVRSIIVSRMSWQVEKYPVPYHVWCPVFLLGLVHRDDPTREYRWTIESVC